MKTLSQKSLGRLIFGRITVILCAQIVVLIYAVYWQRMSFQQLDVATILNICAIMSCVSMLNAARRGFSSVYENVLIFLFDTLYVFMLIYVSGKTCSPLIVMLPLYIFVSTLSLKLTGAIFSTLISVALVLAGNLFFNSQKCTTHTLFTTIFMMLLFAVLCEYIVRKNSSKTKPVVHQTKRDSLLDNVVSVLAHEIKNPVSSLSGVAELIRSDEKMLNNPEQRQKLLGIIERETTRLSNLTEEFLIYSGSEKRRNERIDMDALLQVCCENIKAHKGFVDKNINLKLSSKNTPHIIYGDFQRLEQVFSNILINSVQACNDNGRIVCDINSDTENLTVNISNDGEKIPETLIGKIFEPFFTTKDKGTGLGLAIVKNIIKAHDGEITVTSTEQETSFKMRFKLWQ